MCEKARIKNRPYIYLFLSALLILSLLFVWRWHTNANKRQVLLIHSFDDQYIWKHDFNKGVKDCFKSHRMSVDIQIFYLNAEYLFAEQEKETLQLLLEQYVESPPDLIIVCDDRATHSLLQTNHPLSFSVPIVYCGVDYLDPSLLENHTNVTGITDKPDFAKCYQLGRQLFGRISDIIMVAEDEANYGHEAIRDAKQQLQNLPNLTHVYESYLTHTEVDTLANPRAVVNPFTLHIERIEQLSGNELRRVLFYQLNSFCILPKWSNFYSTLTRMGTAPFLMINNEGFGDGRLGGYMIPGYQLTWEAADIGVEILRQGIRPCDIPVRQGEQYPVFDWEQLLFWKIDPKVLPEGAIIPNMPFSVRHRNPLIAISLIVVSFIVLFVSLLGRLYRRESRNKRFLQKDLLREQKEVELTMNSLQEGVISIDTNGIVLSINNAAISWLHLDPSQSYIGYSAWTLFDIQEKNNPNYLKDLLESMSQTTGQSERLHNMAYTVTSNHKVFPVAGRVSSLDENGLSTGIVVSFRDITAEYTQKEYLNLSLISGDIFAWNYNSQTLSICFDESFFRLIGYPEEWMTKVDDEGLRQVNVRQMGQMVHEEDLDAFQEALRGVLHGESLSVSKAIRIFNNHTQEYQWWEYRASSKEGFGNDETLHLFGVCVNVDAFKQTESELIRMRDEAERSDEMKGLFLANMSHEVRTPLNAIVGFSSLLIDNQDLDPEERKEFIFIINENCRLLLNLINEILDISRIESGIEFREEVCDLNQVVQEVVSMNQVAKPKELELVLEMPEMPVYMISDAFRLKQLLGNLLENAYKFTKAGTVWIGYHPDESEEHIIFRVKDTGVGISQENIRDIFERFYKTDDFVQGGGLGLPIVEEIIKRFGGDISVDSTLGEGSEFRVTLPWVKTITGIQSELLTETELLDE